jgi:Clp amino terminal domain, pathogenicity island component
MESLPLLGFLPTGLVAFLVALVVITVRRALEGGSGVTFVDLATAALIGVGMTLVQTVSMAIALRRLRGSSATRTWTSHVVTGATSSAARFDRFTDRARSILVLAHDEAQRHGHDYVGTEHMLLALLRQGGITVRVLERMDVSPATVRAAIEAIIGGGGAPLSPADVGLQPDAKHAIELAIDEARTLDHRDVGTEHLLLGVVREGEGIAAGVMKSLGVTIDRLRPEVIRELGLSGGEGEH